MDGCICGGLLDLTAMWPLTDDEEGEGEVVVVVVPATAAATRQTVRVFEVHCFLYRGIRERSRTLLL